MLASTSFDFSASTSVSRVLGAETVEYVMPIKIPLFVTLSHINWGSTKRNIIVNDHDFSLDVEPGIEF